MKRIIFLAVASLAAAACSKEEKAESAAQPAPEESKQQPAVEQPTKEKEVVPVEAPWADRTAKDSGFPCDVEKVLAQTCRRCHFDPPENDAPFSLAKWENTQEDLDGSLIIDMMKDQISADLMPPLDAMVSPPVSPLTPAQKKTLLDWLEAGGSKSDQACP